MQDRLWGPEVGVKGQVTLPPSREADFFVNLEIYYRRNIYEHFVTLIHF